MSRQAKRNIMLLIICIAVLATFVRWTSAQVPGRPGGLGRDQIVLEQPTVLAGSDLGFRVVRLDREIPVGQFVVRINGVWKDVQLSK